MQVAHSNYLFVEPNRLQALRMPVYVENVVNCLSSYEKLFGRGKQYRDFLVITLGRGVGEDL